jgi:hypothetical protein
MMEHKFAPDDQSQIFEPEMNRILEVFERITGMEIVMVTDGSSFGDGADDDEIELISKELGIELTHDRTFVSVAAELASQ